MLTLLLLCNIIYISPICMQHGTHLPYYHHSPCINLLFYCLSSCFLVTHLILSDFVIYSCHIYIHTSQLGSTQPNDSITDSISTYILYSILHTRGQQQYLFIDIFTHYIILCKQQLTYNYITTLTTTRYCTHCFINKNKYLHSDRAYVRTIYIPCLTAVRYSSPFINSYIIQFIFSI